MRVLHVITGLGAGGAERQLRDLLRHTRHEAEVVTLTNPGRIAAQIRADGTPVHDLAMRGNTDLPALPRLARLIRRGHFDVVHTHLYRGCVYGRVAARLAGRAEIVATEHSLGATLLEGRPVNRPGVRALYLATERLGQLTIAVSPAVLKRLITWGVPAHRIRMIPNGIDAAAFAFDPGARSATRARLGVSDETPVIGSVGRLEATKHLDRLLHALRGLPAAILLLVGDGSDRCRLEALARDLGVRDRVLFAGAHTEVAPLYSAMDVHASASPEETFGLAMLEALAAGLPTVYVGCPALDDLADPPPHVLRVASAPEALRRGVERLLAAGGRGAGSIPADYDIARISARVDQLYETLGRRSWADTDRMKVHVPS